MRLRRGNGARIRRGGRATLRRGNRARIRREGRARLKVLSSHSNWGVRLDSFDPMLKSRCPAIFKNFF